jgi:hypothetical protein
MYLGLDNNGNESYKSKIIIFSSLNRIRGSCQDSPPVGTGKYDLPMALKNPFMNPPWAVIEITARIKMNNLK